MTCDKCGHEMQLGDWPFCSKDGNHSSGTFNVIPDGIPGGVEIRHGLCNDDGSPRRYYSKSEMARVAKARGLVNHVEHACLPGTDKSPWTTKWAV